MHQTTMNLCVIQAFQPCEIYQRYKVYTYMYYIIHADGKVAEFITNEINEIKKVIDNSALENY